MVGKRFLLYQVIIISRESKRCIKNIFGAKRFRSAELGLAYLAWEMNLLAQIDDQERNSFKLPDLHAH